MWKGNLKSPVMKFIFRNQCLSCECAWIDTLWRCVHSWIYTHESTCYSCVRSDRLYRTGGGTIVYFRDGIPHRIRPDLGASLSESCAIEISRAKYKKLIIWTIYRAPDLNLENFYQDLSTSMSSLPEKTKLVLLGDFDIIFLCSEIDNDKAKKCKLLQVTNIYHRDQRVIHQREYRKNHQHWLTYCLLILLIMLLTETSFHHLGRKVMSVMESRSSPYIPEVLWHSE